MKIHGYTNINGTEYKHLSLEDGFFVFGPKNELRIKVADSLINYASDMRAVGLFMKQFVESPKYHSTYKNLVLREWSDIAELQISASELIDIISALYVDLNKLSKKKGGATDGDKVRLHHSEVFLMYYTCSLMNALSNVVFRMAICFSANRKVIRSNSKDTNIRYFNPRDERDRWIQASQIKIIETLFANSPSTSSRKLISYMSDFLNKGSVLNAFELRDNNYHRVSVSTIHKKDTKVKGFDIENSKKLIEDLSEFLSAFWVYLENSSPTCMTSRGRFKLIPVRKLK